MAITGKLETQVPIGDALTAFTATTNTHTIDTVSTVRIQIITPFGAAPLVSTTEALMKAGANKYALGINGRWELGHFQTATLVGGTDDTWDLTVHLRGRYGTEHNTSNHTTADEFVLLTDAEGNDTGVVFIPMEFGSLAKTFNLKAVTTNQDVASATAESFTWEGEILRPLATINHVGTRDSENDLLIEFDGRTRFGGGLRAYQAGSVNEETEEYRVQPVGTDRVMKVHPGTVMAMLLQGDVPDSADLNTTHNSIQIISGAPAPTSLNARAYQIIRETGNFMEAVLYNSPSGSATFGLVHPDSSWRGRGNIVTEIPMPLAVTVYGGSGINRAWSIYEYGVETAFSETYVSAGADVPFAGIATVRISFVGTEIRVTITIPKADNPTIYRATFPSVFPYAALMNCNAANSKVIQGRMTTNPQPKTWYAADQQTEDGFTPGDPIPCDIWQWSKFIGDGTKTTVTL